MKKILKYIPVLLLFLMAGNSCSEDFLEVQNPNDLATSSFFQTADDAYFAINTVYYGLAGRGMHGLQYYFLFNSFEDRILFETPNLDEISINSSNNSVNVMYRDLYIGLWRASSFIDNLNNADIPDLDDDLKERYIAEARGLRGAYYFHLVVLFNKPVFYDEFTLPTDPAIAFSNGEPIQFWNRLVEDLQFAASVLPDAYGAEDVGRVTRGMANAMLGKAMLYKHYHYHVKNGNKGSAEDIADLELARDAFEEVMNSGQYALMQPKEPKTREDYLYAFLSNFSYVDMVTPGGNEYKAENNSESVWEIQYSDDRIQNGWLPAWQWSGHLNNHWFSAHASSFRNHELHPKLWYEWETEGVPAGFDRDPRAYGTCWLDGEPLDYRPENEEYFNVPYQSGSNNKEIAKGRGLSIPGTPSSGLGLKKYYLQGIYEQNAPDNSPTNRNMISDHDV
jgi:hypothetical protein